MMRSSLFLLMSMLLLAACSPIEPIMDIPPHTRIALIGNNLCSRMMEYGHFEKEMHLRFPDHQLYIRNMCDGGNTPAFRPHSGRNTPWAFEGAEDLHPTIQDNQSPPEGHFEYPDEWLDRHDIDIVMAFFGYNESFEGAAGLDKYKNELRAFIKHTNSEYYSDIASPVLILVSPIAFEDISDEVSLLDGKAQNSNLKMYTEAMREVATETNTPFIDAYRETLKAFNKSDRLTIDGAQMNDKGYAMFSSFIADATFGGKAQSAHTDEVLNAVLEKNWYWHNDIKSPNGVHVFGRRYDPFGPDNYPYELKKLRELTANRDTAIWMAAKGTLYNIADADKRTTTLPDVETNYNAGYGHGEEKYLYGDDALHTIKTPEGYKIELFASEKEFPELANPVQISFDNKGRLWVAVMPTYPHWKPGDPKPNDKLIILEDTNNDGKADKQTVWADNLHIPVGFEFAPEGVYLSQGTNLVLLTDTDGDDKADKKEIIFSGFDDHDTHHVISAFCADPSGAIYMAEGVFLRTDVETAYGPVRGTNGGFYRYDPRIKKLERISQIPIPNPWGIAFDEWGQDFFAETSGPDVLWMMPGMMQPTYGKYSPKARNIIEDDHRVRPTSGLEFLHSRHFPDEVQGDMLIANAIGFLGMKQHEMMEDGTGFDSKHRQDLFVSDDKNFRPVDMEVAPDGSLYFIDWHNVLIGHMQHNARDPLRDHVHGRVYRVTYPSRPLVEPAKVDGASITTLLDNLELPEYRTRYRSRRALRGMDKDQVITAVDKWVSDLDKTDDRYAHHLLEALWVRQGLNMANGKLLRQLLQNEDHRVRAAATKVVKFNRHEIPDHVALLKKAASDPHGRVRLESMIAASWLEDESARSILSIIAESELDDWMLRSYNYINDRLTGKSKVMVDTDKTVDKPKSRMELGESIFSRDGYCATCHQPDGKGLAASGYPPLAGSKWVTGDPERLIKLTLKGMMGPITVLGKDYAGVTPMTPYEGLLNDSEIANVLTYIRSSFGNDAKPINAEFVMQVRGWIKDKKGFYSAEELLKEHPMK